MRSTGPADVAGDGVELAEDTAALPEHPASTLAMPSAAQDPIVRRFIGSLP
ncbi:MAG TPA: hypothetical protein VM076_17580 [Gemmatimonadaceae bacterium]|nr:hypothetical protein [Gemmatimonadaceae bacterium]